IAILNNEDNFILGIEIDGNRYLKNNGYEKYLKNRDKQDFIKSKNYKIYKISELNWKLDENSVIKELKKSIIKLFYNN
ncbi:MAG: hypothetical protein K4H23_05145, partial [Mollicutes bacterium PWAP]|nr:hypothetical protein [Mollicutes bacterium PWAP]